MAEKPEVNFEVPMLPENVQIKQAAEGDKEEERNLVTHNYRWWPNWRPNRWPNRGEIYWIVN
jgi:hypothetical protein